MRFLHAGFCLDGQSSAGGKPVPLRELPQDRAGGAGRRKVGGTLSPDSSAPAFAFVGQRMLVRREDPAMLPTLADIEECAPLIAGPFRLGRIGDREAVAVALAPDT